MAIALPAGYFTATNGKTLATTYGRAATPIRTGGTAIRPYVVPWVPTVDAFGIALDAGLVGVVLAYPSIAATPVPDYETAILTGLQNASYAVPGIIPTGYTARYERDAFAAAARPGGAVAIPGSYSAVTAGKEDAGSGVALNIRNATGLTAVPWHPVGLLGNGQALLPDLFVGQPASSVNPFLTNQYNFPATTLNGNNTTLRRYSVGWRNLGIFFVGPYEATYTAPTGSAVIRLSHNADGSAGSASGDLDTTDYTFTLSGADFVYQSATGKRLTTTYATGSVLPTLGNVSRYVFRIVSSSLTHTRISTGAVENYYIEQAHARESWRVDIPLPYTATGPGDLIAPGGYI